MKTIKQIMKLRFKRPAIDEETREVHFGPVGLDCSLARAHGYSEKQLERMHDAIKRLVTKESAIARRRYPERNHDEDGTWIFLGPCCKCDGFGRGPRSEDPKGFQVGAAYCAACEGKLKRIEP